MGGRGRIFVLDMGEPVRIVDLAEKMIRLSGKEPGREIAIEFVGARPGENLHEELVGDGEAATPTSHEAIMQLERTPIDPGWLEAELRELARLAAEGDTLEVVGTLARLVREPRRTGALPRAADATAAAPAADPGLGVGHLHQQ
jgi:FlaA1/EpsC-like NDP-sugar epimerase